MTQPEPGHDDRARLMRRLCWGLAIVLVMIHGVLAWLGRPAAIATANDDALYLLLGRSLRSLHYLDAHIVGSPVHAQYPPGYPAFIALIWSVVGEHFDAVLLGGILVSVIGLLLTFDLARRALGTVAGLFVLAALAVNPGLIDFAGSPRSESLYMAATIAAIWCACREPRTARWMALAGTLAIYAAMVRTVGVALVLAFIVVWLIERRYRAAALFIVAAVLIVGGWLLWTVRAPNKFSSRSYAAAIQPVHSQSPQSGTITVLARRTEAAIKRYLPYSIPVALSVLTVRGTAIDNAFWMAVIVVGLIVGLYVLWRRYPLVPAYLVVYGAVLAVWPFSLTRFVFPVVPLLLLVIATGLMAVLKRLGNRAGVIAVAVVGLLLFISGVAHDTSDVKLARLCRALTQTSPECTNEDQRSFFAAAAYARSEAPSDGLFLTVKEATFAYITGRRVQHPEIAILSDSLNIPATLRRSRIDYILMSPLIPSRLGRFLLPRCTELTLLRSFPPDTYLFRVLPTASSSRGPACEALASVVANPKFSRSRSSVPIP